MRSVMKKFGFFFTKIVKLDLAVHIPVIVDFWEKVLFGKHGYYGDPLAVHQKISAQSPLLKEHFERWVEIFKDTVDKLFAGRLAETAKSRAEIIAQGLFRRLNEDNVRFVAINKS